MYGCQDWKCWSGKHHAKCGNDRQCRDGMKCKDWKCKKCRKKERAQLGQGLEANELTQAGFFWGGEKCT
jgi:hypothetical protein